MSVKAFKSKKIKVVGFDLDQTLYPKSEAIDQAIQQFIYKEIADFMGISTEDAKDEFHRYYKYGSGLSGSKSLEALGLANAKSIVQEALESADIAKELEPDEKTNELLTQLRDEFLRIDLITGSNKEQAVKKLDALAIPKDTFSVIITGDIASKSAEDETNAYHCWLENYPSLEPMNLVYVGDRASLDHVIPSSYGIQTMLVNVATPNKQYDCPQLKTLYAIRDFLLDD